MDALIIQGKTKLEGQVEISSAKNATLPLLVASLLTDKEIHFSKVPNLRDVRTLLRLLKEMGVEASELDQEEKLTVQAGEKTFPEAPYEHVKTMRASILVLGPLLARFKKAKVSLPGGCAIGARPINIHLQGLEQMGAEIKLEGGYVEASAPQGLQGAKILLPFPSVGATENLLMAATLAKGRTTIRNVAREPEIIDLGELLIKMGAKIEGLGTDEIVIDGVLSLEGASHTPIPDRIEAATFIMMALATKSEIKVTNINERHLEPVTQELLSMGANLEFSGTEVFVKRSELRPNEVETRPHPGYPTDVQAQMMALMTQVEGSSVIRETIFENRFMHVPELIRMGANIHQKGNTAIIKGASSLSGAPVMCTDLRASAALIVAALCAEGETKIARVYHLDRGYEKIDEKLRTLGASVKRISE